MKVSDWYFLPAGIIWIISSGFLVLVGSFSGVELFSIMAALALLWRHFSERVRLGLTSKKKARAVFVVIVVLSVVYILVLFNYENTRTQTILDFVKTNYGLNLNSANALTISDCTTDQCVLEKSDAFSSFCKSVSEDTLCEKAGVTDFFLSNTCARFKANVGFACVSWMPETINEKWACGKITDVKLREDCIFKAFEVQGDRSLYCDRKKAIKSSSGFSVLDVTVEKAREICYRLLAMTANESSFCNQISNESEKMLCVEMSKIQ